MKFSKKHSAIILERVFDCQKKYELIDLVSGRDKRRTPIHRVILMAASKYFADLFQTNDSSEQPEEFIIDSDGEVIKAVVDFCYSGHINLTKQNVEKYLKIAVDGEIDLLLNKCHEYFVATLGDKTVVHVLSIAEKYNLDVLNLRALERLCSDLEHVPAAHILQLNPANMLNLMEYAYEAVSSDLLTKRLLSWFQYDKTERGEHMPKMLRLIQLGQLSAEFLCEMIEPIFKQFKCIELLYDEFKRRALYPSPSSGYSSAIAVMSDKTSVFLVTHKTDIGDNMCMKSMFTVERFDALLSKLTPHFSSPWIGLGYEPIILFENKIFATGYVRPIAYDLKTGKMEILLPMNARRSNHAAIVMGKSFYVFGGHDGIEDLSSCERYDTEKGTWQTIKSMSRKRSDASVAVLDGLIYVVGGFERHQDGTTRFHTSVESYDPKTDEWTERQALDVGTCRARLVAFNGILYAFLDRQRVRAYDPKRYAWTKKIQSTHEFWSVVPANGNLYAVTKNGETGLLTINEGKIYFSQRTKIQISSFSSLSLHQCRFEE